MKVIINSCLLTELLKNFQTSLDNMRVIGETYSVEDMNEEFAKFNIKPDDIIGKTIIFKCLLNVTSFNIGEITSKVSLNTPSSGIIQRSHPRSKFVRFHSRSEYAFSSRLSKDGRKLWYCRLWYLVMMNC